MTVVAIVGKRARSHFCNYGSIRLSRPDSLPDNDSIHTPTTTRKDPMDRTLFDRTFKDGEGNFAIFQKPNLPILVGLSATALSFLPLTQNLQIVTDVLAFGAIFTWAWLELFRGVNYFRRSLGLIVMMLIFASQLSF